MVLGLLWASGQWPLPFLFEHEYDRFEDYGHYVPYIIRESVSSLWLPPPSPLSDHKP